MPGRVRFLWVATVVWAALGGHPVSALGMEDAAAMEIEVETLKDVVFEPETLLQVIEGTEHNITWFTILPDVARVTATVEDEMVAEVRVVGEVGRGTPSDNFTYYGHLNVSALFLGYNKVYVTLYGRLDVVAGEAVLDMSVLMANQAINNVFTITLGVMVAILYVFMGSTIDLGILQGIAKRPVGTSVGIFCQYILMPLIAFGLGKLAFPDNSLARLGLFLMGCSPGGGGSNMWTYLLGGSLNLSILMTFFSTVVAFAAMPLWVLTLGGVVMSGAEFVIPYKDIAFLVFSLSFPCFIGLLIKRFLPSVAKTMEKVLPAVTLFMITFLLIFGVYVNLYIFSLFNSKILLAGFGVPALGYLSGLGVSTALRLPKKDRIAISIETGIQNGNLGIFILKYTLEKPAGDVTAVFPVAALLMTPIPLAVVYIIRRIYFYSKGVKWSVQDDGEIEEDVKQVEYVKKENEKEIEKENGKKENEKEELEKEKEQKNGKKENEKEELEKEKEKKTGKKVNVVKINSWKRDTSGIDNPGLDLREERV